VLRKHELLEPEKAKIFVITIACLHNFLRRNPGSAAIYAPPLKFDCEENGRRAMGNGNTTPLFLVRKSARK
jgi:hypothetical protein